MDLLFVYVSAIVSSDNDNIALIKVNCWGLGTHCNNKSKGARNLIVQTGCKH